tara:strand:- start:133880 stop:134638 length:759 start_codon:yes stop_codon:yes gene_type:complete
MSVVLRDILWFFATPFLLSSLFLSGNVSAEQEVAADKSYEITATATFTSDYVFRGVTQTQDDPAVQAAFDFSHSSGLFAGVWGSNVDTQEGGPTDDEADLEIDLYIGYGTDISDDWSADATAIRYIFPGTANGVDLDWNELLLGLHFREYVSFLVGYSDEVFNIDGRGIYYSASGNYPLAENLRLKASVGYYDLDDALNDNYVDWSVGAEYDIGMFTASLAYIDTDSAAADIFGKSQVDGRVVVSLTASFGQ